MALARLLAMLANVLVAHGALVAMSIAPMARHAFVPADEPLGAACGRPEDPNSPNGDCASLVCRNAKCSYCISDDECDKMPEQACITM